MDTLIQSQKLAVNKITGVCTLLERAGSIITALPNNILNAHHQSITGSTAIILMRIVCCYTQTTHHATRDLLLQTTELELLTFVLLGMLLILCDTTHPAHCHRCLCKTSIQ